MSEGEFLTIIGPSGSGKTTLLNMIAQIDTASGGEVRFQSADGAHRRSQGAQARASPARSATSRRRTICCRGARRCRTCCSRSPCSGRLNDETRARAEMLIRAVGLAGFENHYPHELSGGMRKRASLIRTLVYDPPVILMDEPFGALDAQTRTQLQEDLLRLWNLGRKTIVFVTHDIAEAIALGDRTLVLSRAPAQHRRRARHHHPAPARHPRHHDPSGIRRALSAHQGAGAMTQPRQPRSISPEPSPIRWRQYAVTAGRIALAAAAARRLEARRRHGRAALCRRSVQGVRSASSPTRCRASLLRHIYVTLRLSAIGFAHRLRLRRRAAVPAAPPAAAHQRGRALHHGLGRRAEVCAGAAVHPVVRHRRRAQALAGRAARVLSRSSSPCSPASATSTAG